MNTQVMNDWGLIELDIHSQMNIDGGKSWAESFGYACGYLAGSATNAAEMLGDALWGVVSGEIISKAVKK